MCQHRLRLTFWNDGNSHLGFFFGPAVHACQLKLTCTESHQSPKTLGSDTRLQGVSGVQRPSLVTLPWHHSVAVCMSTLRVLALANTQGHMMHSIGTHTNPSRGSPTATGGCFSPSVMISWKLKRLCSICAVKQDFIGHQGERETCSTCSSSWRYSCRGSNAITTAEMARKHKQAVTHDSLAWWGQQLRSSLSCAVSCLGNSVQQQTVDTARSVRSA